MRQVMMFDERLNNPSSFRHILTDDVERRRFLLDADVQVRKCNRSPAVYPVLLEEAAGRLSPAL